MLRFFYLFGPGHGRAPHWWPEGLPGTRMQFAVGVVVLTLIVVTRGHHFATVASLPGASWAAFFLAGVYLRSRAVLPVLLLLVWALDFLPYLLPGRNGLLQGREVFCLTPGYGFLILAYGALWTAGRWYAFQHEFRWRTLFPLFPAVVAGAAVCELFSSGGFYFFSGRFSEPTFSEFLARVVRFFPAYLRSLVFYVVLALIVHTIISLIYRARSADEGVTP